MTGRTAIRDCLALWENGAADHPLDRAIGLIEAVEGMPRAEAAVLSIDQRDRALYRIAEILFGRRIDLVATCAECGAETSLTFSTSDALAVPPSEAMLLGDPVTPCRMPNSKDLAEALEAPEPQLALVATMVGDPSPAPELVAAAEALLSEHGGLSDLSLAHSCVECGSEGTTPFDVLDYLWRRITAEARRQLRDVHLIAGAYGWTSDAIMQLTPQRRAAHAALIAG
jgi:hypothetical protein